MITVILLILFLQAAGAQTVASKAACDVIRSQLNCSTFPKELICASNGVEYPTHCDFAKFHCDNPSVHIALEGACAAPTSPGPTFDPLCDVVINSNCPKEGGQICGSDGQTYQNLCSLHKEACVHPPLAVAHKGPCGSSPSTEHPSLTRSSTEKLTVGAMITTPMTTMKKLTTTMSAAMTTERKETTTKAATTTTTIGPTTLDPLLCQAVLVVACGNELSEICGSDGKAYKNRCEFQKGVCRDSGLKEESLEKCPTLTNPPTTQTTTMPTTAIPTTQTTPDVTITLDFLCQAVVVAICPVEVKEVCGSDGKTYKNICRYQKAKCYFPNLTVTTGPCKVVDPTSTRKAMSMLTTPITSSQQVTTPTTTPMTSSQHVTTKTTISMKSSQQVTTKTTQASVPITTAMQMTTKTKPSMTTTPALSSLCQVIVTLPCSGDDRTCATDGKVYANKCEYSKAKCYRPSLNIGQSGSCTGQILTTPSTSGNLGVLEVICGTLMQAKCEDDHQPLCASNNVTYDNECEFEKARCNNKNLHVLRFQPCS